MPFKKGKSGNPNGRPKGIKDNRTVAILEIINSTHTALEKKQKDLTTEALKDPKWFYEKIWAKLIPRDMKIELPEDITIIVTKD